MDLDDAPETDRSDPGGPNAGGSRPVARGRSKAPRRAVALLIAAVIAGDAAAIVVRRDQVGSGPPPQVRAPTVLFRDDFAPGTAFEARTSDDDEGVQDETFRLVTKPGADVYHPLPREAPDRAKVLQALDISVAVDVQVVPGDPDTWFGVFCRSGGLDTDTYVADVRPDGAWRIDRRTLGTQGYIKRVLAEGQAPALENPQGNAFVAHLRLDCLGQSPTSMVLSINDTVVGMASDPSGLGPANVGMAGSSRTNVIFDNLVVTTIDYSPGSAPRPSIARTASMVSASAGSLSARYRRTRAKRRATPPA